MTNEAKRRARSKTDLLLALLAALALGLGSAACASAGASALDLMNERTDEGLDITTSGPERFEQDRRDVLDDVERMKEDADGDSGDDERSD